MVGMAVATMVFSTAAMNVAIIQAASTTVLWSESENSSCLARCASGTLLPTFSRELLADLLGDGTEHEEMGRMLVGRTDTGPTPATG